MANEISIRIGGDAKEFVAATKQVNESLGEFTNLTNQTSASFKKIAVDSKQAANALKDVANAGKDILPQGSIDEARANIRLLKTEIASLNKEQLSSSSGKFLVAELKTARAELVNLEKQANISSKVTGNAFLDTIQPVKGLSSQIRQVGRIIPGLGFVGLFSLASTGIELLISSITGLSGAETKLAEQTAKLKKELKDSSLISAEGAASEEGNITKVQALAAVIRDSNSSYAEKKRALQELREVNKNYFGDLKLEDAATGKLTATINEYSKALINSAIQKEFIGDIAKTAKAIADSDAEVNKARTKVQRAAVDAQRADEIANATRKEGVTIDNVSINAQRALTDAQEELTLASDKNTQLMEHQLLVTNDLNKAVADGLKFKDLQTEHTKKEEDALKKRLEALQKIQQATKDASTRVGLQEAIFELQVKITLRDQAKNGLSKGEVDKAILGFKAALQKEFLQQAIELEAIPKVKFSQVIRTEISTAEIKSEVAKATGLDKKITIESEFQINVKFFGKNFADNVARIKEQVLRVKDSLFNGIVNGIQEGSAQIGEAFGNILSGQGVSSSLAKAAQGLLGIIGGILQQVGKEIIITSHLVAALKKAINGLFKPGGEIAGLVVGAALIASGALLKTFKFDVPKLAAGGIATGPTLGIFGEAGREAIIPLDKLPELLGKLNINNEANVVLNGNLRVSGTDLSLLLERVGNRRGRLG